MNRWGKRKLSDADIRKISKRIREIPKGMKRKYQQELAREFKCSMSTIQRIEAGTLTPADIEKPCRL